MWNRCLLSLTLQNPASGSAPSVVAPSGDRAESYVRLLRPIVVDEKSNAKQITKAQSKAAMNKRGHGLMTQQVIGRAENLKSSRYIAGFEG